VPISKCSPLQAASQSAILPLYNTSEDFCDVNLRMTVGLSVLASDPCWALRPDQTLSFTVIVIILRPCLLSLIPVRYVTARTHARTASVSAAFHFTQLASAITAAQSLERQQARPPTSLIVLHVLCSTSPFPLLRTFLFP
jgi:hypothetical protein